MEIKHFIENTICRLDTFAFGMLKKALIGEYLTYSFLNADTAGVQVFAEKVFDYFTAVEIRTGRDFGKQIESYMNDLDAITGPRIARTVQTKKGDENPAIVPRARKYYDKALNLKRSKELTISSLLDYSRIMLCLYTASMLEEDKTVYNFNLSLTCLDPGRILEHMKQEEIQILIPPSKRKRFDLKDRYNSDACTIVITAIALSLLINSCDQEAIL